MGQRYKQSTREKISLAQKPVTQTVYSQIRCAFSLIMNGIEWERPHMVVRGFKSLFELIPDKALDGSLLALRRTIYLEQVKEEKRKHDTGQF